MTHTLALLMMLQVDFLDSPGCFGFPSVEIWSWREHQHLHTHTGYSRKWLSAKLPTYETRCVCVCVSVKFLFIFISMSPHHPYALNSAHFDVHFAQTETLIAAVFLPPPRHLHYSYQLRHTVSLLPSILFFSHPLYQANPNPPIFSTSQTNTLYTTIL